MVLSFQFCVSQDLGSFPFLNFLFLFWDKKRTSVSGPLPGSGHLYKSPLVLSSIFSCHPAPLLSGGAYPYPHRFPPYIQKAVSRITGSLCRVISIFISASTACVSSHRRTGSLSLSGGSGLYTASGGPFHRPTRPSLLKMA